MNTLAEFLRMGGHGAYVWSAYGLSLAVLIVNAVISRRRERRMIGEIADRMSRK
jgi:heme exporter protein D